MVSTGGMAPAASHPLLWALLKEKGGAAGGHRVHSLGKCLQRPFGFADIVLVAKSLGTSKRQASRSQKGKL